MKCSFLIFILSLVLSGFKNDATAQKTAKGDVLYASTEVIKTPVVSSIAATTINSEKTNATIPVMNTYFDNYYGAETFEVYAGEAVDLSLFYLKVTTTIVTPVTIKVVNSNGDEVSNYTCTKHPLVIGYGYKPGLYFIQIIQGRKEMVLRFSKGV